MRLLTSVLLLAAMSAQAEPEPSLPEPLTLEAALALAGEPHPTLRQVETMRRLANAERLIIDNSDGPRLELEGRLRWIEPSDIAIYDGRDDHQVSLRYSQELYDFGRSDAREAAAEAALRSADWLYADRRRQRRLEIMQRYFDVLLTDLQFAVDNEAMAVAYVTLDRLRTRSELGQVSDVDLLELEHSYQQARHQLTLSQGQQRASRARLALALNRPGQLSADLQPPDLPQLARERPEYESLLQQARQDNPRLKSLRAQVEAAQQRLAAAQAGGRPSLRGEVEALAYSHDEPGNDNWRAGVVLNVPLYDGTVSAQAARSRAELYGAETELALVEYELEQQLLELWLELEELKVAGDESLALADYRDLYLERSRANYEMEVQADLGDAMVRMTEAQLEQARRDFRLAMVWEQIDALLGTPLADEERKQ